MKTIIRCGTLIDGNGAAPLNDMALIIENSKISQVVPWGQLEVQDASNIFDFNEQIVVPGLIDSHVHLLFTCLEDHDATRSVLENSTDAELMAVASRNCLDSLLGGITTVRDLGDINFVTVDVRNAVKRGVILGPRILAAGPPVTTTAGHLHWCNNVADTISEIRKAIRSSCSKDVDVIKIMASGGNMTRGSNSNMPQYEISELEVAVTEAHRLNRKVASHALEAQSIRRSIEAGVDTIEHCMWRGNTPEDNDPQVLVELLKGKKSIPVLTLAGIQRSFLTLDRPVSETVRSASKLASYTGDLKNDFKWTRELLKNGVKVVLASDAGVRFTSFRDFRESIQSAIEILEISMEAAISMVTRNASEVLGISDEVGTLTPGKDADITIFTNTNDPLMLGNVTTVFKQGKMLVQDGNIVLPGYDSFGSLNAYLNPTKPIGS
jgi:imidazolonepropionase-like amidohydrolase